MWLAITKWAKVATEQILFEIIRDSEYRNASFKMIYGIFSNKRPWGVDIFQKGVGAFIRGNIFSTKKKGKQKIHFDAKIE